MITTHDMIRSIYRRHLLCLENYPIMDKFVRLETLVCEKGEGVGCHFLESGGTGGEEG